MAMKVGNKNSKKLDPEMLTNAVPKRNSPPTPPGIGGGMAKAKKVSGIDPDAFTNGNPKRNSPPSPGK